MFAAIKIALSPKQNPASQQQITIFNKPDLYYYQDYP